MPACGARGRVRARRHGGAGGGLPALPTASGQRPPATTACVAGARARASGGASATTTPLPPPPEQPLAPATDTAAITTPARRGGHHCGLNMVSNEAGGGGLRAVHASARPAVAMACARARKAAGAPGRAPARRGCGQWTGCVQGCRAGRVGAAGGRAHAPAPPHSASRAPMAGPLLRRHQRPRFVHTRAPARVRVCALHRCVAGWSTVAPCRRGGGVRRTFLPR